MGASVRIDQGAFSDPRFKRLGRLLGASARFAHDVGLARMARVWSYCTERTTYVVSKEMIDAMLDADGAASMIVLAELVDDDPAGIRVRGTNGRIEWLADARASSRLGGRARAAGAERIGGRFTSATNRLTERATIGQRSASRRPMHHRTA